MAFERCTFDSRTVFTGATFDGEVEMDRAMADGARPRLPAAAVVPSAAAAAVVAPFSPHLCPSLPISPPLPQVHRPISPPYLPHISPISPRISFSRHRRLAEGSTSEKLGHCRRQSLEAPLSLGLNLAGLSPEIPRDDPR